MKTTIFAGKGGVGKSTSSVAHALSCADAEKVLLVDYDGGHSLARVLAFDGKEFQINAINKTGIANLYLAVVDDFEFETISAIKGRRETTSSYLAQFHGDYGLLPFCEMTTAFFGVPTDISSVSKFLSLIALCHSAKSLGITRIIIDAEPTAGLKRLLDNTNSITRSLCNLQKSGWATIKMVGAKWPDISAFMASEYIKNAHVYTQRMESVTSIITGAQYIVVSIPESSPVAQMADVEKLIVSFGGNISGYVINNIRNESHEQAQIDKVMAMANNKPVAKVRHDRNLCDSKSSIRRRALRDVGRMFTDLNLVD